MTGVTSPRAFDKSWFFLLIMSGSLSVKTTHGESVNCENIKYSFDEKSLGTDVLKESFSGVIMVCGDRPCCTEDMQHKLSLHSKQQFDTALTQTLTSLSSLLNHRATKFDTIFKEMIAKAKTDFHNMFMKTYGIIYEQNSYVFTDLFKELESYYARGHVDLMEAMDNFFNTLYQKMFTVLNAQYKFDNKYLECVSERMKELKPFGDVPSKLSLQLKRSFVATRTFAQALSAAGSIVNNMGNIVMTASCYQAVAKMTHCPACSGLKELKPCSNYCTNVMKGCLAYHSQLDTHWNDFINEIDKVAERLLGPFNIEMVVEPINLKISEAIMNFQENAGPVSKNVFAGCGKPVLGKTRRSTGEIPFETLQFNTNGGGRGKKPQQGVDGLEKVIKEARAKLKESKSFWKKLPNQMCGTSASEEQENCWNGETKDRYKAPVVGDGMTNQQNNPEVTVDVSRPNSLVNEQVFALKTITSKLKTAYMGQDVEWIDTEETFGSGSGSGYGSNDPDSIEGSGAMPVDTTPPPEPSPVPPMPPSTNESPINNEDNALYPIPDQGSSSYNSTSNRSWSTGGANSILTNRLLFSYVTPIIMIWFGSSVTDWL